MFLFLSYSLLVCIKFINDYMNFNTIFEEELIGLEVEEINNKYNKLDALLYSPLTNNKYNNSEYIGRKTNLNKIHLLYSENTNNILKILNSYKYSENILKTIDNLNNKFILNEIKINNVYLLYFNNKFIYSENKNDIAFNYIYNNKLYLVFYLLLIFY